MDCKLYLDNVDITDRVAQWTVVWDRNAPHNMIDVSCNDISLWDTANPDTNPTTARLKARFGTDDCYFLLEKRDGAEHEFRFSGRSLSALETADHAAQYDNTWDVMHTGTVLEALNSMMTSQEVVWSGSESLSFAQFRAFSGYPLECLINAAEEQGCVVRGRDDGKIEVVKKFPLAPGALQNQTPDFEITDDDIAEDFDPSFERGKKYDSILASQAVYDESPDIVVEDGNQPVGDPVYLRVYWPEVTINYAPETYITAGTVTRLSANITSSHTEEVTFQDGQASLSHRVSAFGSAVWHGVDGGEVFWQSGQKEIRIAGTAACLAKITYDATYERYSVVSPVEPNVFVAFRRPLDWFSARPKRIRITGTDGSNPAPPIDGESVSIEAGKAIIYDSYDKFKISNILIDNNRRVRDGMIVGITSSNPDCNGNFFVEKVTANVLEIETSYTMEVIRWQR